MTITRELLAQYASLKEEIKEIQTDIQATEDNIAILLKEGTVVDKVKGGFGGIQGFKIEGFPQKEYDRRKKLLANKRNRLISKENDLIFQRESIEKFIDEIENSRDRRIFRALYIKNMTQQQIADEICIDRSLVSKIISKYL